MINDHTPKHIDPRPAMRAKAAEAGHDPKLIERFLSKTEFNSETGCLLWTPPPHLRGYGQFWQGTAPKRAHRVSYELFVSPIPDGALVRHACDTPLCVAAACLSTGDHTQNTADKVARGRAAAKLKDRDVVILEWQIASGQTVKDAAAEYGVTPKTLYRIRSSPRREDAFDRELAREQRAAKAA